jgi:hypothetical protein
VDPLGERIAEGGVDLGDPVDVDDGFRGPAGFVGFRPGAVTLGTFTGDADYRCDRLGVVDRVPHGEIPTPRVTDHDPGGDADRDTDALKIVYRVFHGVRTTARAAHAARLRVPGAVTQR